MNKYRSLLAATGVLVLLALGSPWISSALSSDGKSAAEGTKKACPAACGRSGACGGFVDEDKSGVCDRKELGLCGAGQGKGRCAGGAGPCFIDEDGDGICDLRGSSDCPRGQGGRGQGGKGRGKGAGCQAGFVDADGDGICDHRAGRGNGAGRGRGAMHRGAMGRGGGAGPGTGFVDADGDGVCDHRQLKGSK